MDDASQVVMDADAVTEFLGTGGTGVLSLSAGDEPPISRPVSYGFDEETGWLYFRLAVGPDSEKAAALGSSGASFVTYEETDDGWRSVLATGRLAWVEADEDVTEVLAGLGRVHIPLFDVFDSDTRDLEFRFVRMDPDSLTGRAQTVPPE
ncbi:pyridoxamine 5'-phosphate oxidase family protein [Halorarius litoreus]|uniref:pyridoxamine 5'-phosphate oxidase family protein n=1 Tax=Halorarius litoreus TaxID=2962676 RepID=UPI0020CE4DFF|nr:pyridoxamine 5'-phosphate oxidase family protein [Halorarius litoreus]